MTKMIMFGRTVSKFEMPSSFFPFCRSMKIVSWNCNSIRSFIDRFANGKDPFEDSDDSTKNSSKRKAPPVKPLENLFKLLEADIICFQETKVDSVTLLEDYLLHVENYESYWSFCKIKSGYSGVCNISIYCFIIIHIFLIRQILMCLVIDCCVEFQLHSQPIFTHSAIGKVTIEKNKIRVFCDYQSSFLIYLFDANRVKRF